MDRVTIYPGAIPLETDLLSTNKNVMVAIAKLSAAMFGTGTIANGFAVTPTSPASLQVLVAAGEVYSLQNVDGTAYSSIAADTAHQIMKQGISLDTVTLSCAAPTTSGQSINYLIQAAYQDVDATPVVLPYYNATNPSQAYSGPNNTGVAQYTARNGAVVLSAKAGVSATTGSQVTPSPDSGYVGLCVITVAYAQTTITSANIARYSAAPLLPAGVLPAIQAGSLIFGTDTGSANTYVCAFTPAITARTEGQVLRFKVKTTNNGACTFNDGVSSVPLVGGAHAALQGGEMIANGDAWVQWNSSVGTGSYILLFCTGAPEQVAPASQSQHAIQLAQMAAVVGGTRNGKMSVTAASATAAFTADEVAVKTALGGPAWLLNSFSKTINLATTGAGGMDTGTAPASGFVGIYAIYNPTTGVSALLAVNATSAVVPEVYGGANMPTGYTASALLSVWPTTSGSLLQVGYQNDRTVSFADVNVLTTATVTSTLTALSIASAVPANAKRVKGGGIVSSTSTGVTLAFSMAGSTTGVGKTTQAATNGVANGGLQGPVLDVPILTTQTIYYTGTVSAGTITFQIYINQYTF